MIFSANLSRVNVLSLTISKWIIIHSLKYLYKLLSDNWKVDKKQPYNIYRYSIEGTEKLTFFNDELIF